MNAKAKFTKANATSASRNEAQRALPFVFVNFAMTADGKTAFADRTFVPFTSKRDREHMMELRATADAVMCGARTVESDDVILGTGGPKYRRLRIARGLAEHNLRVLVTGTGSVNPEAAIFKKGKSPLIILTTELASKKRLGVLRELADEVKVFGKTALDFHSALAWLRKQWNVKRLLCEGGGELNAALVQAGLVHELHVVISPQVFGGRYAPTLADGDGFTRLSDAAKLKLKSRKRVGDELFLVFSVGR